MFRFTPLLLISVLAIAAPPKDRANAPARNEIDAGALTQESDGSVKHLRGAAFVRTSEMEITADEIDYDQDSAWAHARGHVHMDQYITGESIVADHGEYNLRTQEGRFYVVTGTAETSVSHARGLLTTANPFTFQAKWAERIGRRYILHDGIITDCKFPKPWWTMDAPKFDVVPGDHALARNVVFHLHTVPIFYLPYFYRPLGANPRSSGFLTPNVGHSSQYGWLYGAGYYWAVNRSYDMTGIFREYSKRGPAIYYEGRAKPSEDADFDFRIYDVDDKGLPQKATQYTPAYRLKQGGNEWELSGSDKFDGFEGRMNINYLSSFTFRQVFSYTFASSIPNEVDSVGFLMRHFDDDVYTLSVAGQRNQDFLFATPINQRANDVAVTKAPAVESGSRIQEAAPGLWFSYQTSVGALMRSEPIGTETTSSPAQVLNTGAVARADFAPSIYSYWHLAGFSFAPTATFEGDAYSNSYQTNYESYGPIGPCNGYQACPPTPTTVANLSGTSLFRKDVDFSFDVRSPVLDRVFHPKPKWHLGSAIEHSVDAELVYDYTTGVDAFQRIIHFDTTDLLSNTNQLIGTLTNRLYKKDKNGHVSEILNWRLSQARYFDPTFGGAVTPGQRFVTLATEQISPYAFLDGPRGYSPAVSVLTMNPGSLFSVEWRAEYDPRLNRMIVNGYTANVSKGNFSGGIGQTSVRTNPLLFPQSNQITYRASYGRTTRTGTNLTFLDLYDFLLHRNVFQILQANYNTDCCGFGVEYKRINFGLRDENQYLFSFTLANIGTFGSMQRQ